MEISELNQKELNEQMYLFVKRWLDDLPFDERKKVPVTEICYCLARLAKQDELLKKQEPKQVIDIVEFAKGMKTGRCPSCARSLVNLDIDESKFCKICGQAVKWDDNI